MNDFAPGFVEGEPRRGQKKKLLRKNATRAH